MHLQERTGVEGAMFVVSRSNEPRSQLRILNKRSKKDFEWGVDSSTEFDLNGNLLSFR